MIAFILSGPAWHPSDDERPFVGDNLYLEHEKVGYEVRFWVVNLRTGAHKKELVIYERLRAYLKPSRLYGAIVIDRGDFR